MRKYISAIIIFVLSMCFMGVQNQDVVEAARQSYSVPGKSVSFWDEAKNFILVPEFSGISGRGYAAYADLSSAVVKENGLYAFVCNRAKAGDNEFRTTGTLYIKVINEKAHQFEFKYDGEGINNYEWRKVGNIDMDTVMYILDNIKSRGLSTGNVSPTPTAAQNPMSIDLMKCWQEDVDACTVENGSMLTVYDGMPEEELKQNFIHWQVKNYEHHPETKSSQEYIKYSLERGDNRLREILDIYKIPSENTVSPWGIAFNTNQRLLARQIFERFKKNLSALYEERPMNHDGTRLMYTSHDHYLAGNLTIISDYKKDLYKVIWTGMSLTD